jgi:translocation and assembly module TamB
VQGKGIDTRLSGVLTVSSDGANGPRLVGAVNTVGGQYRAYGQRLDVEQGVLRFTGPLDNPSLDILAIRSDAFQTNQRVGVQITGTALIPRIRLYAQPELPDAEKLAWLITGKATASGGAEVALLQQAALALIGSKTGGSSGSLVSSLGLDELSFKSGSSNADGTTSQAAVTLGKRFSRNFYAAYERSVSGALGTLYIFYDLSQRFTVRAQAGQQSAVDLIYTLRYD